MATVPITASTSSGLRECTMQTAVPAPARGRGAVRRRRISPEAGRALEILGHAIEYLTDEFVHAGGYFSTPSPQVEAVKLLMGLNREIYFECPVEPNFYDRLRYLLHLRAA